MSATLRFGAIVVLFSCLAVSSAPAEILVSKWELKTTTAQRGGGDITKSVMETRVLFPFDLERTVTDAYSTVTTTRYDFTYDPAVNANYAAFNFEFDHAPGGGVYPACHSQADIWFTVSEEVPYSLRGTYATQNGDIVIFQGILKNLTTKEFLFLSDQERVGAANWELTLGEAIPGVDVLIGQPVGTLLPGYQYLFEYEAYVSDYYPGPTSASGFVQFVIPEPASLMLLSLGGLVLLKRRPRR